MRYECDTCGDSVEAPAGEEGHCAVCGGWLEATEERQAVPVEEVRELVKRWRVAANHEQGPDGDVARGQVYNQCADELEDLINDK